MKCSGFLIALLIFSFTVSLSLAQNNWYWQNPQPQGIKLNEGKFLNPNTGFAVGDKGTIIKTTDGGADWAVIYSDTSLKLTSLCVNSLHGIFIGGREGLILKSTNLGLNWTSMNLDMYQVNDLDFVNKDTGYAVGSKIYKTTNGGNNWIQQLQINTSLYAVSFSDPRNGIAVGDSTLNGLIYKTVNGGTNWISMRDHIGTTLTDVYCLDSDIAYIATQHSIFKTTNGGDNWVSSYYHQHAVFESVYFTGYENGFAVGNNGLLSKTFDGGLSWYDSYISNSVTTGNANNLPGSINFCDSLNGLIAGDYGLLIQTTDGGNTWFNQKESIKHFRNVFFVDENTGFVCGQTGTILKTTSSGIKWNTLYTGFNGYINDMCFINSEFGIAVCDSGAALKTTNGGINWTRGFTPTLNKLVSVSMKNTSLGIAGSSTGYILRTTNGGFSWNQVYFGLGQNNIDVSFPSVDTAFATGSKGLLRSTNSGVNWTIMVNGNANTGFTGLQFFNSTTGYIAGWTSYGIYSSVKLIKTYDGCLTLDTFSYGYSRINFSDLNNGIGYSILGNPKKTTNGGISWTSFDFNGISNTLNGAFNVNQNVAYFVGDFGAIIKADNVVTNINNTEHNISDNFLLQQNFPNPFNPLTIINYQLAINNAVSLKVYDALGKEVAILVNEKQNAGSYSVEFNGKGLPSGIYFYKLEAGDFVETRRMVLLK
jgi:photosystem II stability/assembly factor-like uncharacterized protein